MSFLVAAAVAGVFEMLRLLSHVKKRIPLGIRGALFVFDLGVERCLAGFRLGSLYLAAFYVAVLYFGVFGVSVCSIRCA